MRLNSIVTVVNFLAHNRNRIGLAGYISGIRVQIPPRTVYAR